MNHGQRRMTFYGINNLIDESKVKRLGHVDIIRFGKFKSKFITNYETRIYRHHAVDTEFGNGFSTNFLEAANVYLSDNNYFISDLNIIDDVKSNIQTLIGLRKNTTGIKGDLYKLKKTEEK